MKIKEDYLPHAKEVLAELLSLQSRLAGLRDALRTFDDSAKEQYKTLPKFLAGRRAELVNNAIEGFTGNYPHINTMVSDGQNGDAGMFRLHDGIYKLGQTMERLKGCKFMVKADAECLEIRKLANEALADFVIFTISQYGLAETGDYVYLSVSDYCNREGMTRDVFYGILLNLLDSTGESVYGYESISPFRDDLYDADATFMAECEEANFPLDDEMSQAIISGKMPLEVARGKLQAWLEQMESKEVPGLTLGNMVQRLNLG